MGRRSETTDGFWKRDDSPFWSTNVEGKRVCTKLRDLEAARLWRRERERQAADPHYAATHATTLGDAVEAFLQDVRRTRAAATLDYYTRKLASAVTFWGEDAPLASVDPQGVRDWISWRTTERTLDDGSVIVPPKMTTVRKEVLTLVTMLHDARHREVYQRDPATLLPPRLGGGYRPRDRFLTPAEFEQLLAVLPPHRAAWVCAAVATGGRYSEVSRLRRADVRDTTVAIRVTKTASTEGDVRMIPLLSLARPLMDRAVRDGDGTRGRLFSPWSRSNLSRDLARACARADIPRCSSNDFRRTLASWLFQAGVAPKLVAFMLGHTTSAVTERTYGRMTPASVATLVETSLARTADVRTPRVQGPSEPVGKAVLSEDSYTPEGSDMLLAPAIQVRILAPEPSISNRSGRRVPLTYRTPAGVRKIPRKRETFGEALDEALALGVVDSVAGGAK